MPFSSLNSDTSTSPTPRGAVTTGTLQMTDLRRSFGGALVIDVPSLTIPANGVVAIIGPNGAGKTTLFDLVSGYVRPSGGRIHFDGASMHGRAPDYRARKGLVRTFQLTRVFERLTVLENMLIGSLPGRHLTFGNSVIRWRRSIRDWSAAEEQAFGLLSQVGLENRSSVIASELSGGQKKLLEFSRAQMANPSMLLLDEPLAGVGPGIRDQILEHIRDFVSAGRGVVLVEHDLPRVMKVADRVVVLDRGQVIADGSPNEIADDPRVMTAYLGGRVK